MTEYLTNVGEIAPIKLGLKLMLGDTLLFKCISTLVQKPVAKLKKMDKTEVGEVAELVLKDIKKNQSSIDDFFAPPSKKKKSKKSLTVEKVISGLRDIATVSGSKTIDRKMKMISSLIFLAKEGMEAKYLIRLLNGNMKIGLQDKTVIVCIAKTIYRHICKQLDISHNDIEEKVLIENIKRAYAQSPDLGRVMRACLKASDELISEKKSEGSKSSKKKRIRILTMSERVLDLCKIKPGLPVRPMLAQPMKSVQMILNKLEGHPFTCEHKYDGMRLLIHRDKRGKFKMFSRRLEDVTHQYPDLLASLDDATKGIQEKPIMVVPDEKDLEGHPFTCEHKYDGMRLLIHRDKRGKFKMFSRRLEDVTHQYPDLLASLDDATKGIQEKPIMVVPDEKDISLIKKRMRRGKKEKRKKKKGEEEEAEFTEEEEEDLELPEESEEEKEEKKEEKEKGELGKRRVNSNSLSEITSELCDEKEEREEKEEKEEKEEEEITSINSSRPSKKHSSEKKVQKEIDENDTLSCVTTSITPTNSSSSPSSPSSSSSSEGVPISLELVPFVVDYSIIKKSEPSMEHDADGSYIIDAEVIAYDKKTGLIKSFQDLTKRGRVQDTVRKKAKENPVKLFVFDIIYFNGKSLTQYNFATRRSTLHNSISENEKVTFARYQNCKTSEEITEFFDNALACKTEGLMVKTLYGSSSFYRPDERSRCWTKLKKDYLNGLGDSLDLVVMGAYEGNGDRSGVYGSFLCGVVDEKTGEIQTTCCVGSGLTDKKLQELKQSIKPVKKPPERFCVSKRLKMDYWFDGSVVFEVKGADLFLSPVHRGSHTFTQSDRGIGVRFPRFLRERDDKTTDDATSAKQLFKMFKDQAVTTSSHK
ncbi:DNA ligase, ATP-dependent like protein [Aduncisulcus paluster]|uniref:DNA ligase 1 n=1 Tax=Aduncisulcus paluster TaxID=2918883 RepID=A0ABQ5KA01_9EUKA|nr:DNA ligase, ATP-dependent like protein [Aduncisulcus paluster]